jgi:hypothetical protein
MVPFRMYVPGMGAPFSGSVVDFEKVSPVFTVTFETTSLDTSGYRQRSFLVLASRVEKQI